MLKKKPLPFKLKQHIQEALSTSEALRETGDFSGAWLLLEKAHILGQAWPLPHLQVHYQMLRFAYAKRDLREVIGQILRLLLVLPGTWLGRLPRGNTGGANVSPFAPMPIPDELAALLQETT